MYYYVNIIRTGKDFTAKIHMNKHKLLYSFIYYYTVHILYYYTVHNLLIYYYNEKIWKYIIIIF